MKKFKIAAAQIGSLKDDIPKNIESHLLAIDVAAKNGVSVIIFPELSLSGYEPEMAEDLAVSREDERLVVFSDIARKECMYIAVGAPLKKKNSKPTIGVLIFYPDGEISEYSKMNLHPGEDEFFAYGTEHKTLEIENNKAGLAICADITNPAHVEKYISEEVSIYVSGVLITENGYIDDTQVLMDYSKKFRMLVVMANHNSETGKWKPVGRSAIWSNGQLLAKASETKNSLLISHQVNGNWTVDTVDF